MDDCTQDRPEVPMLTGPIRDGSRPLNEDSELASEHENVL